MLADHHDHGDESFVQKVEEDVQEVVQALGKESGGAIFGAFDGVTAVLGVLVSLLSQPEGVLVRACVGLAIASAIGMGFGQYTGDKERKIWPAVVIGLATAVGTMLPVIPFAFIAHKQTAIIVATILVVLLGILIGYQRSKDSPKRIAYGQTFILLVLATAVNVGVAIAFPGSGG